MDEAARLIDALADRVASLSPSRRDPHRFFEERDEIAHALEQVAGALRRG